MQIKTQHFRIEFHEADDFGMTLAIFVMVWVFPVDVSFPKPTALEFCLLGSLS